MKQCPFCNASKLYTKSPTQLRCVTCKRTWSVSKYQRETNIIDAFLENQTIEQCSKNLNLNYLTIKKIYYKLRLLVCNHAQECYLNQPKTFSEYDEFYYLPYSKQKNARFFLDAVGIFGMVYESWVYTLLLPDQLTPFKRLMEDESTRQEDNEAYARYLNHHKMTHVKSFEHRLGLFWSYFETFMRPFKGVKKENLFYYLKEAEFKFNYTKERQKEILICLWRENM